MEEYVYTIIAIANIITLAFHFEKSLNILFNKTIPHSIAKSKAKSNNT